jgi:hypothetical protein
MVVQLPTTKVTHTHTHTHTHTYIYIERENAPTLVATMSCPVATGAHSGCNLFTSGCN